MADTSLDLMTHILGSEWIERELEAYRVFRETWSPKTRWYHRKPTVSPIVPLIYWNTRESVPDMQEPFGYWGGNPTEIMNRLTEELQFFRGYWESLPNDRGAANLKWALSKPYRFFSLSHELATAFQFASRERVMVEPLFLDPQSSKGKPDLIVRTRSKEFAVQCKSEDPSKAHQLPYDLFQYFAGIYQRAVEDSGKSYHLSLHLKKDLNLELVSKIRNHATRLIEAGISTPYPWKTAYCDFELSEIGEGPGMISAGQIRSKVLSMLGDMLYHEIVPIEDALSVSESTRRGSTLFISGRRGRELDQVIGSAVTTSLSEAQTRLPLIVAVHLYQDIDFREFKERPVIGDRFIPWTDRLFAESRNLAMIFLSSNNELYRFRSVGEGQIAVKYQRQGWVLESPVWDHADVAELGI